MYNPEIITQEFSKLRALVSIGNTCKVNCNRTSYFWTCIYRLDNGLDIVLLCEVPDNDGLSITNSLEFAANHVLEKYNLNPKNTVIIEHYSERVYKGKEKATFDIAQWNNKVSWKTMKESIFQLDKNDVWDTL